MKIRYGFVSNSSSMSFIVSFPNEIKTEDDINELIFQYLSDSYKIKDAGENVVNKIDIIKEILRQISVQKPNDEKKAIDILEGFIIIPKDVGPVWYKYNTKILSREALTLERAKDIVGKLKEEGQYFYTFTFDSSDYVYQAIASSLLFIDFKHIHILNH